MEYSGPERALCGKLAWQGAWVGGGAEVFWAGWVVGRVGKIEERDVGE